MIYIKYMLKNKNFVAFDFETTGVDVKKDEPIQIGIVKFDNNFHIIEEYSSYIKPKKNIKELSHIVEFITSIKLKELNNKPYIEDIMPKIKQFFDKDTIVVWHNIPFDIAFMEKYWPEFSYEDSIDTFIWSKVFYHWKTSYAQDVLTDSLWMNEGSSHDALVDSRLSMRLFENMYQKLNNLIKNYPVLQNYLLKSETVWKNVLDIHSHLVNIEPYLPRKSVEIKGNKKIIGTDIDMSSYRNKTVFDVSGCEFKELILAILGNYKKTIFCFHHKNRLSLIKNVLNENYISYSPLKLGAYLDKDKEKKFLSKEKFSIGETKFIIKAFSHFSEWVSMFDLNDSDEYKVYNYLKANPKKSKRNVVLATHYDLFSYLKENGSGDLKDYQIIFFDFTYWMGNLSRVINRPYDFYHFISMLEQLAYYYENESMIESSNKITEIVSASNIYFASLCMALNKVFKWTDAIITEIPELLENIDFWKVKNLYLKLDKQIREGVKVQQYNSITGEYGTDNWEEKLVEDLLKWWDKFSELLKDYATVRKVMYHQDKIHYIFNPVRKSIDIHNLNDILDSLNIKNFTPNSSRNWIKLCEYKKIVLEDKGIITKYKDRGTDFKELLRDIESYYKEGENIFLISTRRDFSKALFELIFKWVKSEWLEEKIDIFAENITWWWWKNIFYMKSSKKRRIVIWGLEFFMAARWENLDLWKKLVVNISGPFEKNILKDLYFYV